MTRAARETCPRGGIVRSPRRPDGWYPPGPEPPGPQGREDLWPAEGEDLCFLTGHWRLFQRLRGHRYSLDDVATAWFALEVAAGHTPNIGPLNVSRSCDLGCGIGSVLLMVAWKLQHVHSVGVEAQELSVGLARRSVVYNGAESRIDVRHGDLRDAAMFREDELASFDLVTGTPPYIPLGDGVISDKEQCGPCRFEFRGGIEEYCETASRLLAPGAPFVCCHAASQVERVEAAAASAGLAVASRRDVIPRSGRDPLLAVFALVAATAGVDPVVLPPLVVRAEDGTRTGEYLALRKAMGMPP